MVEVHSRSVCHKAEPRPYWDSHATDPRQATISCVSIFCRNPPCWTLTIDSCSSGQVRSSDIFHERWIQTGKSHLLMNGSAGQEWIGHSPGMARGQIRGHLLINCNTVLSAYFPWKSYKSNDDGTVHDWFHISTFSRLLANWFSSGVKWGS